MEYYWGAEPRLRFFISEASPSKLIYQTLIPSLYPSGPPLHVVVTFPGPKCELRDVIQTLDNQKGPLQGPLW